MISPFVNPLGVSGSEPHPTQNRVAASSVAMIVFFMEVPLFWIQAVEKSAALYASTSLGGK